MVGRSRSMWTLALTATVTMAAAGGAAAQPLSEERIKELVRQAAQQVAANQTMPRQDPSAPVAPTGSTVVRLTLDEAVTLALDRNLDIAVQRLNPQINDIAVAGIKSVYHPSLTSTISQLQTT